MNDDGLERSTKFAHSTRKPGFRWLIVLAVLSLVLVGWLWVFSPDRDPRLVGEWQSGGSVRIFHADGRLEILDLPTRTPVWPGGQRWWRTEGDELVTGTQTMTSRAKKWFQNQLSSWTKVQVIGLNDSRYKIIELTETRLKLHPIRKPPAPPRPAELFHRGAIEGSNPRSQSALAP